MRPKEQLVAAGDRMAWVEDFSEGQLRGIGLVEVLGALGLILPGVTGVLPILTPLAATGLALTMVVSAIVHIRRQEPFWLNIVLLVLSLVVAFGRFFFVPL